MPEDIKYILKVYVLQLLIIICFYLVGKGFSKIFFKVFLQYHRLFPRLYITLHNVIKRPWCWRHHFLISLNIDLTGAYLEAHLLTRTHGCGRNYSTSKGEKLLSMPVSFKPYNLLECYSCIIYWYISGTNSRGMTNHYFIVLKPYSLKWNSLLWKPVWRFFKNL